MTQQFSPAALAVNPFLSDLLSFLGEIVIFSTGIFVLAALLVLIAELIQ
jgi:hypothetical protein